LSGNLKLIVTSFNDKKADDIPLAAPLAALALTEDSEQKTVPPKTKKEMKQAKTLAKNAVKQAEKAEHCGGAKLAEKASQKAKQAEKQAEKEAKKAEKQAEKEAKKAAKQAEKAVKQAKKEAKQAAKQAEKEAKQKAAQEKHSKPISGATDAEVDKCVRKMEKLAFKTQKLCMRMDSLQQTIARDAPHRKLVKATRKATQAANKALAKSQKCQQQVNALKRKRLSSNAPEVKVEVLAVDLAVEYSASSSSSDDSSFEVLSEAKTQ